MFMVRELRHEKKKKIEEEEEEEIQYTISLCCDYQTMCAGTKPDFRLRGDKKYIKKIS